MREARMQTKELRDGSVEEREQHIQARENNVRKEEVPGLRRSPCASPSHVVVEKCWGHAGGLYGVRRVRAGESVAKTNLAIPNAG